MWYKMLEYKNIINISIIKNIIIYLLFLKCVKYCFILYLCVYLINLKIYLYIRLD